MAKQRRNRERATELITGSLHGIDAQHCSSDPLVQFLMGWAFSLPASGAELSLQVTNDDLGCETSSHDLTCAFSETFEKHDSRRRHRRCQSCSGQGDQEMRSLVQLTTGYLGFREEQEGLRYSSILHAQRITIVLLLQKNRASEGKVSIRDVMNASREVFAVAVLQEDGERAFIGCGGWNVDEITGVGTCETRYENDPEFLRWAGRRATLPDGCMLFSYSEACEVLVTVAKTLHQSEKDSLRTLLVYRDAHNLSQ
eukprot:762163-Hanusia_phi.AAC.6